MTLDRLVVRVGTGWLALTAILLLWLPRLNAWDAQQWYAADLANLYGSSVLNDGGFVYSPVAAQLVQPLQALPFAMFVGLTLALNIGVGAAMVGPWIMAVALLGMLPMLRFEVELVQVNFLVGAAIWYGLRYPALWSVVLLTKLTPGIGLLWFAVRREWRNLGIALGVTGAVAGLSFLLAPQLWVEWFGFLRDNVGTAGDIKVAPLWLRGLVAVGLIVYGARTDRPWLVPIAAVLVHASMAWPLAVGAAAYFLRGAPEEVRDRLHERRARGRLRPANQEAYAVAGGRERL